MPFSCVPVRSHTVTDTRPVFRPRVWLRKQLKGTVFRLVLSATHALNGVSPASLFKGGLAVETIIVKRPILLTSTVARACTLRK